MAASQRATGCYKCGGTGHWARDCPADGKPDGKQEGEPAKDGQREWKEWKAPTGKKKQAFDVLGPKRIFTRPKLTEDVLLSKDKGIGYILQEFPKLMEIKGRGHEVGDLRRLLELYQRWHKMVFPSVTYSDFVEKVEKLGTKKRVRSTIRDLRHRIVNGEDNAYEPADVEPTAWGTAWEQQVDQNAAADGNEAWEKGPSPGQDGWETGIGAAPNDWGAATGVGGGPASWADDEPNGASDAGPAAVGGGLTAEQRARIEANKARAVALRRERAAKAAEGRAAEGEGVTEAEEHEPPPPGSNNPAAKSMRQRLADDTDDDDDVIRNEAEERVSQAAAHRATSEERSVAAQKKRARKEMLDRLAQRRGAAGQESSGSDGDAGGGRRRRPKRTDHPDGDKEGNHGAGRSNGQDERPDGRDERPNGRNERNERANGLEEGPNGLSDGVELGAGDGSDADAVESSAAEQTGGASGTQNGKRRRLLKTDVVAELCTQNGLEDALMDDVEAVGARAPARARRNVVLDSDDDE